MDNNNTLYSYRFVKLFYSHIENMKTVFLLVFFVRSGIGSIVRRMQFRWTILVNSIDESISEYKQYS